MSWGPPRCGAPVVRTAGTARSPLPRGCRPRNRYVAGYRAGVVNVPACAAGWLTRILGTMVQRPPTGTIPDAPGLVPVQGRGRAGHLRRQGPVAAPAAVELLREPGQPAAPHRADGGRGRDRRVDPGPQRRRGAHARVQPHQAAPAPVQHPAAGRQELPVPRRHPRRRVAPADGDAGPQAQGRPLLRALRPRLRDPRDARPAAAHVPAAHLLGQQVRPPPAPRPAVPAVPHREVLRALRRRGRPRRSTPGCTEELLDFLDGDTDDGRRAAARRRCRRRPASSSSSRRPACATGSRASQKAIEKQQMVAERSEDLDVIGIAEDELEAAVQVFFVRKGRVVGRKGFIARQGRGPHAGRADRHGARGPLRRPARSASPSRCSCPTRWTTRRSTRSGSSSLRGSKVTIRVPQRGDKRELQETVTRNAKEEFVRHRLRRASDHNSRARALNELQDAPRPARGPAAHRVLRHEPHPGQRLRRLDGGARGRPARRSREYRRFKIKSVPGQRRLRGDGGGAHPAAHRLPRRAATGRRATRPASSPTRRSCCSSTAARASSAWPCGCSRSSAWPTRSRWPRWPSGSRRSTCRARPTRSACPASPRRSTCCSASATRPTASPSRTTASCAASA